MVLAEHVQTPEKLKRVQTQFSCEKMRLQFLITAWVAIISHFQEKGNISGEPKARERETRNIGITAGRSIGKASKGSITW